MKIKKINPPFGSVRLTNRERQVLCLVSQGLPTKKVAEQLYISKRTVDFHLTNIYKKFQVDNRIGAILIAMRLGLI